MASSVTSLVWNRFYKHDKNYSSHGASGMSPAQSFPVHSLKRLRRRNTGKYCILRLRVPKGHILDFLHRSLSRVGVPSRHPRFRFVQKYNRCCELISSLFILPSQLNIVTENDDGYSRSCWWNDVRNRFLPMENGSSSLNLHPAVDGS